MKIRTEIFAPFRGGRVFAGFSGGADSTAALLVAADAAAAFGFELTAVHINHHWRGAESDAEAAAAADFAAARGIDFLIRDLEPADTPENLESSARAARLAVWRELCREVSPRPAAVVLGHHADDRVENMFLRLLRGGNSSSLSSLRESARVEGVNFLRPLAECSRREIEAFLVGRGVDHWAEDSSNADGKFLRNFLRHSILDELYRRVPGGRDALQHAVEALRIDAEFIEECAARELAGTPCTDKLTLDFWSTLHPALAARVLREFVSVNSGRDYVPSPETLARLSVECRRRSGEKRCLPLDAERSLVLRGNELTMAEPARAAAEERWWHWRREPQIDFGGYRMRVEPCAGLVPESCDGVFEAAFDAEKLPEALLLTGRRAGDSFVPFGGSGAKKLKKMRTDQGVPGDAFLPVLRRSDGEILWAAGVRRSDQAALGADSRSAVRMSCTKL